MAVPTYDELLAHYEVDSSTMRETFDDKHLRQFSLTLDIWETLAKFLEMPTSDIANIKSQGDAIEHRLKMLEHWKQRRGSMATHEAMVKVLLQISRTDLAEKVISLRRSSRNTSISTLETSSKPTLSCLNESSLMSLTPSASSNGINESLPAPTSVFQVSHSAKHTAAQKVIPTLTELENEFYKLVTFIEATLKQSNVQIDTITRRFSMLPQSIRRRHQTDENYTAIRQKILDSDTVKRLFDNLTALKHWNYIMTPDTLAHILKDIE